MNGCLKNVQFKCDQANKISSLLVPPVFNTTMLLFEGFPRNWTPRIAAISFSSKDADSLIPPSMIWIRWELFEVDVQDFTLTMLVQSIKCFFHPLAASSLVFSVYQLPWKHRRHHISANLPLNEQSLPVPEKEKKHLLHFDNGWRWREIDVSIKEMSLAMTTGYWRDYTEPLHPFIYIRKMPLTQSLFHLWVTICHAGFNQRSWATT